MSDIPGPNSNEDARVPPESSGEDQGSLDPQWRVLFDETSSGLRAFLRGRLSQESDIDDCLQVVFLKLIESGGQVAPAARRAWLFRVAANESARMWRSKASTDKMLGRHGAEESSSDDPSDHVVQSETNEGLHQALRSLPDSWQEIVRLRINQNLTFQQIATQLNIPLGTALTRMRRALERLKTELETDDDDDARPNRQ